MNPSDDRQDLEQRVTERTAALASANAALQTEIAERRQIEAALRQSEQRLAAIAANVPGVVYRAVLHADSSVSMPYISPRTQEVFGISPEEFSSELEWVFDMAHPEDRSQLNARIWDSAAKLEPFEYEYRTINFSLKSQIDGKYNDEAIKWVRIISQPHRSDNGDIVWDGVIIDDTARKRAETLLQKAKLELETRVEERTAELRDANQHLHMEILERRQAEAALRESEAALKQKAAELEATLRELQQTQSQLIQTEKMSGIGQLVAGVAHEINNPVTFIFSNLNHAQEFLLSLLKLVQLYQAEYPNPSPLIQAEIEAIDLEFIARDLPKMMNSMKIGAQRIRQTVESLRNFTRHDEAEVKAVNIHEGLDNTLLILQHRLVDKNNHPVIQIIKEYSDLPKVECYAGQLNQVFINILTNAVNALEKVIGDAAIVPSIWIRTQVIATNRVEIRIMNNGYCIPSDIQKRLFDPFFTTSPVGKGTGMGLAISYQIVTERHGGKLYCISEPDYGTEFVIEIPVTQVHAS